MNPSIQFPPLFLDKMAALLPDANEFNRFLEVSQRPLRKSIRINTLKVTPSQFIERAKQKGWHLDPIPWCEHGFWIEEQNQTPLGNSAEHMSGWFYIQEASSMLPVTALFQNQNNYQTILDCAAAPGSKTTQIAAQMNNQGLLIANEYSASRLKVLHSNIERCGVVNTALTHFDASIFKDWLPEAFDAVLLDAPCSGEGTVRKDADALKNWSQASCLSIAETQKQLIESAFHALKPGGRLVYSTCTLSPEENQQICQYLLEVFGDAVSIDPLTSLFPQCENALTKEGYLHVFPQTFDSEGFFIARFTKNTSTMTGTNKTKKGKLPFTQATRGQKQAISEQLQRDFELTLPEHLELWFRDKEVWLFPSSINPLLNKVRFSRIGIKIAETYNKGVRWKHQLATCLGHHIAPSHCCELSTEEAREWFMGRDVRPAITGKGEVLVTYQGMVLGLGKWVSNRIKNGLPRELVRDNNLF
ncbi:MULTISPECIES: 16S rRNA (cytosine(1407)-C(5))-methyltransferase RsmF [unclassified Vibrio]|uniref:Ribosomal RNA small subunit methyltransferase F n=1 Tax=Vibrio sp. HB236076 TaxID=3232307 RepID=A0AB39HDC0_9VIBR|nr:16S rRNA (cytosine(1407)-C(5))-methyltransferase RsmF [Vibrio sp. HB161653]MDP5253328.1 16S rRNA (cytosine(1407)-C(5))-methyltransferase RsmF [Vibrio sp. HB161653]